MASKNKGKETDAMVAAAEKAMENADKVSNTYPKAKRVSNETYTLLRTTFQSLKEEHPEMSDEDLYHEVIKIHPTWNGKDNKTPQSLSVAHVRSALGEQKKSGTRTKRAAVAQTEIAYYWAAGERKTISVRNPKKQDVQCEVVWNAGLDTWQCASCWSDLGADVVPMKDVEEVAHEERRKNLAFGEALKSLTPDLREKILADYQAHLRSLEEAERSVISVPPAEHVSDEHFVHSDWSNKATL